MDAGVHGSVTLAPRAAAPARRALGGLRRLSAQPRAANILLACCWGATRLALVLGLILGQHYCDPWFYHYAGQLAAGQLPYRDIPVEYPPLAMVLILLPALPLLPFAGIAPRPDPAFTGTLTHLPMPDPVRYSAYGLSFACEMLLIDVATLWLVRLAARRLIPSDPLGLRSGLLYILLIFVNGALLQKFDLAVGALCLAAVLALAGGRERLGWGALAGAALVKGFPILLAPIFAIAVFRAARASGVDVRVAARRVIWGGAWCVAVIAAVSLPILVGAGWGAVRHTLLYHTDRGTEIESLYANVQLALGWLPGMHLQTAFTASDLSRIVQSSLDTHVDVVSVFLLTALLLAAYLASTPALLGSLLGRRGAQGRLGLAQARDEGQVLVAGALAVLLAFILAFRALPAHYLLVLIPLAAVWRPPTPRLRWAWIGSVLVVALAGQALTLARVWSALKAFAPWAVALLSVRNLAWVGALAIVLISLRRWSLAVRGTPAPPLESPAPPRESVRRRVARRWRRLIAASPPVPGFSRRDEDVAAHLLSRVSPGALVAIAGACSALIYLGFVNAFPILALWNHPHADGAPTVINDMGRITGYAPLAAVVFVAAVLALFACQFLALVGAGRIAQRGPLADRGDRLARYGALLFPAAFIAIMIWMQPVTTTDLYGYLARGYLYVFQHANPMTTVATHLPGGLTVDRPAAPYGPAWLLVAAAVTRLAGGQNLLANMLAFKFIAAGFTIVALLLVDRLARALSPERRLRIYVLFGWSPLLLFEAIGNGHNDIVMMVCVLAAFICMLRGRARAAFALFVLGALIKYVAAVFLPLWLVYELRRAFRMRPRAAGVARVADETDGADEVGAAPAGLGEIVRGQARAMAETLGTVDRRRAVGLLGSAALIGGALVAVFYAPFWAGLHTFTGLGQQLRPLYYNSSVVSFLTAPLRLFVPVSQYPALDKTVRLVFYALFGTYTLIQVHRLWTRGPAATILDVITAAAKVTFAALLLITFWFQPWYIVWLLPLAALATDPFVRRQATILAAGALMTYAVSSFLLVNETGLGRDLFVQFFQCLVTFGPLLILRGGLNQGGLASAARRYLGTLSAGLNQHPIFWERIMLVLVLVVAAMLRLLRLGNIFAHLTTGNSSGAVLKEISDELKLFLSDPSGLNGPFTALRELMVHFFGHTPLAVLLPSAIIGTLTVLVIYLLASEILLQGGLPGRHAVALLAALLAATSHWHVSLSRTGMEVVVLPLLMCTALYCLLLAFRLGVPAGTATPRAWPPGARGGSARVVPIVTPGAALPDERRRGRLCLLLYAGCGVCTGLASDLAPGLWLLPFLVIGFLLVGRWRLPSWFVGLRPRLLVLAGSAFLTGLPALWYVLGRSFGLPAGSAVLARPGRPTNHGSGLFSLSFWGQVAHNAGDVLRLLAAQDYSAGYPSVGGTPIIPVFLTPVFFLGVVIVAIRWRNMASLALLLLVAMPLLASVAVGSPTGVIEAASVLPATCIIPALALYEIGVFLGHLPIVLDRINGTRIFSTPEQIGRILLLIFLTISAIRTFYWYFEATLPAQAPGQYTPTYVEPRIARAQPGAPAATFVYPPGYFERYIERVGLPNAPGAGIVQVRLFVEHPA